MKLTNDQRRNIVDAARAIIDCPTEREAEESAHATLAAELRAWIDDMLSPEDASTLALHNCLSSVSQLQCSDEGNKSAVTLCFCPRDYRISVRRGCHRQDHNATAKHLAERKAAEVRIPLSWSGPYGNESSIPKANRTVWWPKFLAFHLKQSAHDDARNAIIGKLQRGLEGCSTMKQAIALWPHAAAMLPKAAVPPSETESAKIAAELSTVAVRSS